MLYALHGFLGKPTDWMDVLDQNTPHHAIDLFKEEPIPLSKWGKSFNEQVKLDDQNSRILLGYSLGGRLALHALTNQPNNWKAAIIISAHPGLNSNVEKQTRLEIDHEWARRFQIEPWDNLMTSWNGRKRFQHDMFTFDRHEKDYDRTILSQALKIWSLGEQTDLSQDISRLQIPILWIAGEEDEDYSFLARKMTLRHPLSKIWIAPKAGHRVPWQRKDEFLKVLNLFLTHLE